MLSSINRRPVADAVRRALFGTSVGMLAHVAVAEPAAAQSSDTVEEIVVTESARERYNLLRVWADS
jgi:hypothetical protein